MHILIGVLVGLFRGDVEVMGAIKDRQRDVQYKLRGLDVSPYLGGSTGGEYQLAITPHTVEHSVASYAGTIARSSPPKRLAGSP